MDIFHCQTVRRAKMKHLVLIVGCLSSLVGYIQSAPAVIWYAPFLSGGGYCSEAHSFVRGIVNTLKTPLVIESTTFSTSTTSPGDLSKTKEDISLSSSTDFSNDGNEDKDGENTKKQEEENPPFSLYVTQHGDSINPTFLKDLPGDMETLLEEVYTMIILISYIDIYLLYRYCIYDVSIGLKNVIFNGVLKKIRLLLPFATRNQVHGHQLFILLPAVHRMEVNTKWDVPCLKQIVYQVDGHQDSML
jgi:hypothetical protein